MQFNSKDCLLAWAAGLFEGEGCINTSNMSVHIEMTDEDVLVSFKDNFGGSLIKQKLRKNKFNKPYKQTWKWALHGEKCFNFIKEILPFLHIRRTEKANLAINVYHQKIQNKKDKEIKCKNLRENVFKLKECGLTHKAIALKLNVDRSYVSHILNKTKLNMV